MGIVRDIEASFKDVNGASLSQLDQQVGGNVETSLPRCREGLGAVDRDDEADEP
jgi:hypothetical protein